MHNPFDPMIAKKRMEDLTTYKPEQHDDESEPKQPRILRRRRAEHKPDDKR